MSLIHVDDSRKLSTDDRDLIDAFIKSKGVELLPPSGLPGNEATRATNRLIAEKRAEFRKNKRAAAKK